MNLCFSVEDLGEFYNFIDTESKNEILKDQFVKSLKKISFKVGGLTPVVVNGVQ